jgi:hypothetical protein
MPHRRRAAKGSFGSNFDELVKQFPAEPQADLSQRSPARDPALQEKIDIHSRLFERAWEVDWGNGS